MSIAKLCEGGLNDEIKFAIISYRIAVITCHAFLHNPKVLPFHSVKEQKKTSSQEGRVHTSVCRYLLIKDSIRLHKFRFGAGLDSNVFNVVHPAIWKA